MTEHEQPPGGQRDAEDDLDLERSLAGLGQLALGVAPLAASLERIAALATQAIPGADGAGLTMLEDRRAETIVMSAPFVREIDGIQYSIGEGPCITAAAEARTVRSGELGDDRSWPSFGPRAAALGVHSVLSLPLILDGEVLGALNVYAHQPGAFTDHAAALGEVFAVSAAVSVHNARILTQAQRLAGQLQTALTNRAVIDQAIGILISRQGAGADEAFAALRGMSQSQNLKLSSVAERLVEEAARRARARRPPRP